MKVASVIKAVDEARTDSALEQQRLGALRATTVKRLSDLDVKQEAWNKSYQEAVELSEQRHPRRAREALERAEIIRCWSAPRRLMARLEQALREVDLLVREGDAALDRAKATFDLKTASEFYRKAIDKYADAGQLDLDHPRPAQGLSEAKRLNSDIASTSKNEVLILTDPGDARVVLSGTDEQRVCPATPCSLEFESLHFDKSGGSFIDQKRLLAPLVAEISKEGYQTASILLTRKAAKPWKGSIPGHKVTQEYYYIAERVFSMRLLPLRQGR